MPFGLGYEIEAINAIIDERKSAEARAATHRTLLDPHRPTEPRDGDNHDNVRVIGYGNNADYLTARIARDRPDIIEGDRVMGFQIVSGDDVTAPRPWLLCDHLDCEVCEVTSAGWVFASLRVIDGMLFEDETFVACSDRCVDLIKREAEGEQRVEPRLWGPSIRASEYVAAISRQVVAPAELSEQERENLRRLRNRRRRE